jgi:hypothetical protein
MVKIHFKKPTLPQIIDRLTGNFIDHENELITDKLNEEVIAEDDGDRRKRALIAVTKLGENADRPPILVKVS